MRGGGGGAHPTAIVYEPELTLDLPPETTVGTAMNALAHCAEALYAQGHNAAADEDALAGAALISKWLPRVVAEPTICTRGRSCCSARARRRGARGLDARARARDGAGGRRRAMGCRTATLNGIVLAPALRFNARSFPRLCAASATRSARRRSGRARRGADRARRPDPPERARRSGTRPSRARRGRGRARRQPRQPEAGEPRGDRAVPPLGLLARDEREDRHAEVVDRHPAETLGERHVQELCAALVVRPGRRLAGRARTRASRTSWRYSGERQPILEMERRVDAPPTRDPRSGGSGSARGSGRSSCSDPARSIRQLNTPPGRSSRRDSAEDRREVVVGDVLARVGARGEVDRAVGKAGVARVARGEVADAEARLELGERGDRAAGLARAERPAASSSSRRSRSNAASEWLTSSRRALGRMSTSICLRTPSSAYAIGMARSQPAPNS